MNMTAGKLFATLQISSFRLLSTCFLVVSIANLLMQQTTLTSLLPASFMPALFLFATAVAIRLIRHLKTKHMFWTNSQSTALKHMKKAEVVKQI